MWGLDPLPPPLKPRVASLTGFVQTSSWPQEHDTHPIDASLLALWYNATESYCLVIGDTLGVSKYATTRVEYRVSKALSALGLLGRGLVLFPTSDAKGVSDMLLSHIKYRITHMLFPTLMRQSEMN